ncbi:hypothetical protein [Paenibacillus xylaniclasticus]|uniref:hypothetical protein n=1 Tax=Paenibacillus xylaniclasticus TaxID=588083 RepID=UPI000FD72F6D|nr:MULTISPECIES: hypothetical protein [Paenibacillus]GFN33955.1 hypothetical protein PCURB6_42150 [Paenibacillus curdlanolyticus]
MGSVGVVTGGVSVVPSEWSSGFGAASESEGSAGSAGVSGVIGEGVVDESGESAVVSAGDDEEQAADNNNPHSTIKTIIFFTAGLPFVRNYIAAAFVIPVARMSGQRWLFPGWRVQLNYMRGGSIHDSVLESSSHFLIS